MFGKLIIFTFHHMYRNIFLNKFMKDTSPFLESLIPPFWTSSDICPGFQSQGVFSPVWSSDLPLVWSMYLQIMYPQALSGVQTLDYVCRITMLQTIRPLRLATLTGTFLGQKYCSNKGYVGFYSQSSLLPPAYVVQGEGNSFTLLVCPHLGGYHIP